MRLQPSILLGGLLLVGSTQAATAQKALPSCAAADSVLSPTLKGGGLKSEYNKFTDSTQLRTKTDTRAGASMTVEAAFLGRNAPADSIPTVFRFELRQPQLSRAAISTDYAQLSAESVLYLLLDGETRVALNGARYSSSVSNGYGLVANTLDERLVYPLSFEQLVQLASASKVELKIGPFDTTLAGKVLEGARDLVRYLACRAPTVSP